MKREMTLITMEKIAEENGGTILEGFTMTMTDSEIRKAIKHGFLKEVI